MDYHIALCKIRKDNRYNELSIFTFCMFRGADKSLARPTSQCILFNGEDITFNASIFIYISSINIPPIMIVNKIHENQNLLSL
jgi:hypothetical protein